MKTRIAVLGYAAVSTVVLLATGCSSPSEPCVPIVTITDEAPKGVCLDDSRPVIAGGDSTPRDPKPPNDQ